MRSMKRKKITNRFTWFEWVSCVILILYALSMAFVLFWGIMNSFKGRRDFNEGNIMGLPNPFTLESYKTVFGQFYVSVLQNGNIVKVTAFGMIMNSILYAFVGALLNAGVPLLVAYVAQKFRCWYSKLLTMIVIVTLAIPVVGTDPAKIQILNAMNLYDTMLGSWVLKFSFLGMYYLVFLSTFEGLSKEYYEAAYLDGAGEWRVLFSIVLPMVKNVFMTVVLLRFIYYWNDYEIPLLYLPNQPVLARGVYELSISTELNAVPQRLAGCMVLLIPIMAIYLVSSKQLFGNISMGGLKE